MADPLAMLEARLTRKNRGRHTVARLKVLRGLVEHYRLVESGQKPDAHRRTFVL